MSTTPPTVTGYSGFYDPAFARDGNGAEASYNAMTRYARSNTEMSIARWMAKGGFRGVRRIIKVLLGAAPGSSAAETYTRVGTADQTGPTQVGPGGVRAMETFTANSGNTTSAQETYVEDKIIDARFVQNPTSYPTDASGNGGGGKLGV